jgi:phage tail P2-like protein
LLPWLAWALSDRPLGTDWSEDQKRDAVAKAIDLQRKKGTPASSTPCSPASTNC